jgi:hypothetical protein
MGIDDVKVSALDKCTNSYKPSNTFFLNRKVNNFETKVFGLVKNWRIRGRRNGDSVPAFNESLGLGQDA